jgi:hypothetical protein
LWQRTNVPYGTKNIVKRLKEESGWKVKKVVLKVKKLKMWKICFNLVYKNLRLKIIGQPPSWVGWWVGRCVGVRTWFKGQLSTVQPEQLHYPRKLIFILVLYVTKSEHYFTSTQPPDGQANSTLGQSRAFSLHFYDTSQNQITIFLIIFLIVNFFIGSFLNVVNLILITHWH